jgi:hypothetical protein
MAEPQNLHTDLITLRRHELDAIVAAITAMHETTAHLAAAILDRLDARDGDPDLEDDDPAEHDGTDEGDVAWTEWDSRGRRKDDPGVFCRDGRQCLEDYEDDDPDHGLDEGEPNFVAISDGAAGCPIADPGEDEHDREEDRGGY